MCLYMLLALYQMAKIRGAFSHWADNTCIRFREVPTNQDVSSNHLLITRSDGYEDMVFSYRAMHMHYSTKRGIAIACSQSVCLSVRLSVTLVDCDHIDWKSWKLITRTISPTLSTFVAKGDFPTPRGTWENFEENRGGVDKSGVLEHKNGNISETRKDGRKVTMEDL